ncbi:neuronal PAS domain-containing protein 3-like isoform X2 [Anneissia japonica]|uniref:neuronal PAS domain-containing protein 3-like isoform X2 n=1 Tax=Anneissia japonica TaxID=1529436 RepID=UPI00142565A9|nr:neuronal PAS domain-containing protein 3-like isoform X2 [Anneissia japonica]
MYSSHKLDPRPVFPTGVESPNDASEFLKSARVVAQRKEKSRDAARTRRGKENYEFYELAKLLPLPAAITSQLDKASIIRLTISYLRMRELCQQGDPPWNSFMEGMVHNRLSILQGHYTHHSPSATAIAREVYEHHLGSHLLQSLDGFLFVLSNDGRFLYISETVSIYLGLSQVELTGSSMFEYVHPGDHSEMAEKLGMKIPLSSPTSATAASVSGNSSSNEDGRSSTGPSVSSPTSPQELLSMNMSANGNLMERSFIIRMKSTLTKRGVHIKSSGYKVIHITCSMRPRLILSHHPGQRIPLSIMGLTGLAYSLPPPSINEIRLDSYCFVCRVDLSLIINFCENKISDFLDYTAEDVTGKSLYSFLHAQDIAAMKSSHNDLLNKGQVITKYFRWMTKAGGYIWIESTATLLFTKTADERAFVFVNNIVSKVELSDCVMDINQMTEVPKPSRRVSASATEEDEDEEEDPEDRGELKGNSSEAKKDLQDENGNNKSNGILPPKRKNNKEKEGETKRLRMGGGREGSLTKHQLNKELNNVGTIIKEPMFHDQLKVGNRENSGTVSKHECLNSDNTSRSSDGHSNKSSPSIVHPPVNNDHNSSHLKPASWENPPNREISRDSNSLPCGSAPTSLNIPKARFEKLTIDSPDCLLSQNTRITKTNMASSSGSTSVAASPLPSPTTTMASNFNMASASISGSRLMSEEVPHDPTLIARGSVDSANLKQEPSIYSHSPGVITAVTSPYAGVPYANYSQYSKFSQFPTPVNFPPHSYQLGSYSDSSLYKSFQGSHDMPMDLSYNNIGGYSNMAFLPSSMAQMSAAGRYISTSGKIPCVVSENSPTFIHRLTDEGAKQH